MKIRMLHKMVLAFLGATLIFSFVAIYVLNNMNRLKLGMDKFISLQKEIDYFKNIDGYLTEAEKVISNIYFKKEDFNQLLDQFKKIKEQEKNILVSDNKAVSQSLDDFFASMQEIASIERR